jgi:hypothetical protein
MNDTSTCALVLIITISDTSKDQTLKNLDSDNQINVSRLIVYLVLKRSVSYSTVQSCVFLESECVVYVTTWSPRVQFLWYRTGMSPHKIKTCLLHGLSVRSVTIVALRL